MSVEKGHLVDGPGLARSRVGTRRPCLDLDEPAGGLKLVQVRRQTLHFPVGEVLRCDLSVTIAISIGDVRSTWESAEPGLGRTSLMYGTSPILP
jgi:hypothetical protein